MLAERPPLPVTTLVGKVSRSQNNKILGVREEESDTEVSIFASSTYYA